MSLLFIDWENCWFVWTTLRLLKHPTSEVLLSYGGGEILCTSCVDRTGHVVIVTSENAPLHDTAKHTSWVTISALRVITSPLPLWQICLLHNPIHPPYSTTITLWTGVVNVILSTSLVLLNVVICCGTSTAKRVECVTFDLLVVSRTGQWCVALTFHVSVACVGAFV